MRTGTEFLPSALLVAGVATASLVALITMAGCGGEDQRPNVMLVVLDTVRRDAAGATSGPWAGLTPNLSRLATEGTHYSHAWTAAPWTVPSHASLFTGLLPSGHHCSGAYTKLGDVGPTSAELLAKAGYDTAAFYSNPWLADRTTGLLRGFAVRQEAEIGGLDELTSPSGDQGGRESLQNLAAWLNEGRGRRPFFVFVNFLEAHLPYDPPAEYRRQHLADLGPRAQVPILLGHLYNAGAVPAEEVDWGEMRRLYGGDVYTADMLLGGLVSLLKRIGEYENTVLIVTSDHGENLGDHNFMDHQFSLHETLLAVPLVIRAPPDMLRRCAQRRPVVLTDLYATVLAIAGVNGHEPRPHSLSLLDLPSAVPRQRPVIAEYAGPSRGLLGLLRHLNADLPDLRLARAFRTVRKGNLRLTLGSDGSAELHDLAADPKQLVNLAAARPDEVGRLRQILSEQTAAAWVVPGEEAELDSLTRRQLESLGYIR